MCNAANCTHRAPADLDDDLGDLMGGDVFTSSPITAEDMNAGIELARNVEVRMHKEVCRKCRGSGRFIGYTGRDFGPCFACKGKGHNFYRQSLAEREKRAEQRRVRQEQARVNLWESFSEQHPDEAAWCAAASKRGFNFASEMVTTVTKFGRLTEKQMAAVQRFMAADAQRDAERAARAAAPVATVTISAIMGALKGSGLKRAALRFAEWAYSMAPEAGQNAGHVYVKSTDGEYLGKISPTGEFRTVRECTAAQKAAIMAHVASMQTPEDVRAAAILSGKETGVCCCCGRELTDPNSIEAGIGPVCASKWGF